MRSPAQPESVKPYGDHLGDGWVQVSFALPLPYSAGARRAAAELAGRMGLSEPEVVYAVPLERGTSYFIVYGRCQHAVAIAGEQEEQDLRSYRSMYEIEELIAAKLERSVVVVGASTGTDTHSVGIDAILNMKGYDGQYGLERYRGIDAHNLGSQVPNEVVVAKVIETGADALLVSQTVTQQNLHVQNLTELVDMVEAAGLRERLLLICGGPRISNELAQELGYDAGFSKGTYANHVASFIVDELICRAGEGA